MTAPTDCPYLKALVFSGFADPAARTAAADARPARDRRGNARLPGRTIAAWLASSGQPSAPWGRSCRATRGEQMPAPELQAYGLISIAIAPQLALTLSDPVAELAIGPK